MTYKSVKEKVKFGSVVYKQRLQYIHHWSDNIVLFTFSWYTSQITAFEIVHQTADDHMALTYPPEQSGRLFADDIFRCIFVNEKFCILVEISLKFIPKGPIDNNPALVQIMAWRRTSDKPLSEPRLARFCGTRGRWVNGFEEKKQSLMSSD